MKAWTCLVFSHANILQCIVQDPCLGLIDWIEGRLVVDVLRFSLEDVSHVAVALVVEFTFL